MKFSCTGSIFYIKFTDYDFYSRQRKRQTPLFSFFGSPSFGAKYPVKGFKHPVNGAKHFLFGAKHPVNGAKHFLFGAKHPVNGAKHPMIGTDYSVNGANYFFPEHIQKH